MKRIALIACFTASFLSLTAAKLRTPQQHKEGSLLVPETDEPMKRVWVRLNKRQVDAVQEIKQELSSTMKVIYDFGTNSIVVEGTESDIQKLMETNKNIESVAEDALRFMDNNHMRRHRKLLQWNGQAQNYGVSMVQANLAHESGLTGEGVTVCVIDDGVDVTHEDFLPENLSGESVISQTDWTMDHSGHGTFVSGIIAARDNDHGLLGVAPEAKIHVLKIFDESGTAYSSDLISALYRCRDVGAKIISMSLGGFSGVQEERELFAELYEKNGILSIASAGNSGSDEYIYPASYSNVISVGAIDRRKEIALFSTRNNLVDIVAPGLDVWSTLPANYDCLICTEKHTSGYASLDGTSFSAPFVAGVAALLWGTNTTLNVDYIRNALLASAQDLGRPGRDGSYGEGLVQAVEALKTLQATVSGEQPLLDWSDRAIDTNDPLKVPLSCSEDEFHVVVNIKTDSYPDETLWEVVRDIDGFAVMSGAGLEVRSEYLVEKCLPKNCYTFSIYDAYGDGNCCVHGEGDVYVSVDRAAIVSGGDNFTTSLHVPFGNECIPIDLGPKPVIAMVEIVLELRTDPFPFETAVSLTNTLGTESYWTDRYFDQANTSYTLEASVYADACYLFEITDTFGDGLSGDGGGYTLFYDGTEVHSGKNFSFSDTYMVGGGCDPE